MIRCGEGWGAWRPIAGLCGRQRRKAVLRADAQRHFEHILNGSDFSVAETMLASDADPGEPSPLLPGYPAGL